MIRKIGKVSQLHSMSIRKKRCDNRGSSIVIVIIAMAMIGILATTLLWMAYMNYMIKVADIRNKNSFYSAETVVEQIMAGVQNEASEAVKAAYDEVMSNWDNLETEENRFGTFATVYLDTLADTFRDSSEGAGYYDRDILKKYVDAGIFAPADYPGVDAVSWENGNAQGETEGKPTMEMANGNSIILHNIYVSYTDENDRVSIVQTDICMDVPKLIFTQSGSIDRLYEYSLIGNGGIEVSHSSGTVSAEGSMYAGVNDRNQGGFRVNYASTLAIDNAVNIISKGDIDVEGPGAGFIVREVQGYNNSVYAENLKLYSGTLSLDSVTYVANDLSLSGAGSKATLTKEYYGYGVSAENGLTAGEEIKPEESSAIIINGKNSTVDMSGIKKLLLAGRAYIGQNVTEPLLTGDEEDGEDSALPESKSTSVMMGESVAVKGDQIAYLVPAECIGTNGDQLLIGQNPATGEQASDMIEYQNEDSDKYVEKFQEVDFSKPVYKLGNKSLQEFGVTSMKNIRKVNTTYSSGDGTQTLVYYYLVMDKDDAAAYFQQYYNVNSNKEAIDRYFNQYASGGILLGDYEMEGNQYTILGNSLVSDALSDGGVTLLNGISPDTSADEEGEDGEETELTSEGDYTEISENTGELLNKKTEAEILAQAEEIRQTYAALTTNLTEDASAAGDGEETGSKVFGNIIREEELENYFTSVGASTVTYTTDAGLKAIVTKNDFVLSSHGNASKIRLVISTGDVTVDCNFTGLIIAKGKITIDGAVSGGASIKRDSMGVYKVLNAVSDIDGDTIIPLDLFVDGGGSMANGAEEAKVNDAGNLDIDYSEIVRYMNWIKK